MARIFTGRVVSFCNDKGYMILNIVLKRCTSFERVGPKTLTIEYSISKLTVESLALIIG